MLLSFLENFSFSFARLAMAAVILISATCGLLSPVVVLKERSYLSDTMSHLVFPGIIIGLLISYAYALPLWLCVFIGALVTALIGSYLSEWFLKVLKIPSDSAAIISLTAFFAFGMTLISHESRVRISPEDLLFGDALTLKTMDLYILAIVFVFVFLSIFYYKKHWNAWLSDSEFAKISGYKVGLLDRLFPLLITSTVLSGIFAVGGLMISALITLPAIICQPKSVVSLPVFFVSILLGLLGIILSFTFNFPVGPSIVLVGFITVLLKAILVKCKIVKS